MKNTLNKYEPTLMVEINSGIDDNTLYPEE
jgi:hypothetical protein